MHPKAVPSSFLGKIFLQAISDGYCSIAGSPDIFQSKMSELMESLEYVLAYLDDLLCLSRSSLEDHPKKLEEVLRCLHDVGLKVNAKKN
jgi:hypothetical protein